MADERGEVGRRSTGEPRRLFLPTCLVVSAVAAAALACAFYFRGQAGDYNLYWFLDDPQKHWNEYDPADASRDLAFPGLAGFAVVWAAGVGVAWLWMARRIARRDGTKLSDGLAASAVAFAPLLALLLIPAHNWLGLPLTILPVFLLILCVGACAAVGAYLVFPSRGFRRPREGTPSNPSRGFPHPREGMPGGAGAEAGLGYPPAGAEARGREDGSVGASPSQEAAVRGRWVFSVWSVWAVALAYTVVFSTLSLREYWALHTGYHDSGMYGEAIFHASQGDALRSNWVADREPAPGEPPGTGLAIQWHCELILVPIAWLYRLWPHHEFLLILQSAALGLGAPAVYLLALGALGRGTPASQFVVPPSGGSAFGVPPLGGSAFGVPPLGGLASGVPPSGGRGTQRRPPEGGTPSESPSHPARFAAWSLAVAYLLAPSTAFVNLPSTYGFRPLTLLVPALLWAIAFLERRSYVWFFFCALLALVVKEEAAPAIVMLGVFIALRHRRWAIAAGAVALGVGWFLFATRVILPTALDRPYVFPTHLQDFGSSAGGVVGHMLSQPLATARYVFGGYQKVMFIVHLAGPLLLLPLLSPTAALVGAANLVILLMATWYGKYTILLGAQAPVLPGLYLAAAYGMRNLAGRETWLLRRLVPARPFQDRGRILVAAAAGLLAAALLAHYFFFLRTMPWWRFKVYDRPERVAELRRVIPRDATLCASYRLATHFTDQRELHLAPSHLLDAGYAALDLNDDWAWLSNIGYRARLLRSRDYAPVFAKGGYLVFQRGAAPMDLSAYRRRQPPNPQYPVGQRLEAFATLIGYDATPTPLGLQLTLYWRCDRPTTDDYGVTLDVRQPERAELKWSYMPAEGVLPTWRWRPGEIIVDPLILLGVAPPSSGPPLSSIVLQAIQPAK